MKTYEKNMQTYDAERLAEELKTMLDLGDKLIDISGPNTPVRGIRTFTFEEAE